MTVELHIAGNDDIREWDRISSESPHGTLFHQWNWLKIAEKYTRTRLYPLIGIKNGIPVGVFPLFFQKKGPARMVFSPPPHAAMFYLGPAMLGYNSLRQEKWEFLYADFIKSAENFIITNLRANYISIGLSPALQDPRPFTWSGYAVEPAFDYVTDLRKGADYLFQSLDKKQRQDINRAKKRGISVERGGQDEISLIMDLMTNRYEEQAKIVTLSKEYLTDIFDSYRDNITVFVTRVEGEIVTGLIDLHYQDTLYSWIGNPKPRVPVSPSPNDLMAWEAILYGCDQKFKSHVTMSAAGNERLHTYYASKFEPELSIRFNVKRTSYTSGLFEKGYTRILKPLRGKMKHFVSRE
jgi:CelD/BcsL family acetyltransferase involved in cellulose biosynthesis